MILHIAPPCLGRETAGIHQLLLKRKRGWELEFKGLVEMLIQQFLVVCHFTQLPFDGTIPSAPLPGTTNTQTALTLATMRGFCLLDLCLCLCILNFECLVTVV